jgi:transcription elongation factor Elf1
MECLDCGGEMVYIGKELVDSSLVYKDKYWIFWCPECGTEHRSEIKPTWTQVVKSYLKKGKNG